MMPSLPLPFRVRQIWLLLLLLYVGCILVFQYTTLQRVSGQSDFSPLAEGDVAAYLKKLLYYFPFELISAGITIKVLSAYRQWFNVGVPALTPLTLLRYEAAFLPAIVLAIPLFCPLTNAVRYGVLYAPEWGWSDYFPLYFFTWPMFLNYLLPTLLFGYGFINLNLVLDYFDRQSWASIEPKSSDRGHADGGRELTPPVSTDIPLTTGIETPIDKAETGTTPVDPVPTFLLNATESPYLRSVVASDASGQTHLWVKSVYFFTVQHKTYVAHTADGLYSIHKTMAELEAELDPQCFYRLNRSVIINLHYVKNYSHWEYDKYIVRLTDNQSEFVMQRTHLRTLQQRLSHLPR